MNDFFDNNFPDVADLKRHAKKRIPTFGFRLRDIRNGLAMPPKMTISNIRQMLSCPQCLIENALAGKT